MATALKKKNEAPLYERDFYAWLNEQAEKLRARSHNELDWDNLAEEIESVGRSDKREIRSRLEVLVRHLLKWEHQPKKRKYGWLSTISEQRLALNLVLEDSPSLKDFPSTQLAKIYPLARMKARDETKLAIGIFPEECPYSAVQILDEAFFPGSPWSPDELIED